MKSEIKNIDFNFDKNGNLTVLVTLPKGTEKSFEEFFNGMNDNKKYTFEVSELKKKRSINANSYCWILLEKLARACNTTSTELYKMYIRLYAPATFFSVKNEALQRTLELLDSKGLGDFAEEIGKSNVKGYTDIRYTPGSSKFNTKEMSRFVDRIVEDCKEVGIETMTPEELERLKGAWK